MDCCLIINYPDSSVPGPVSSLVNRYSKYLDKVNKLWQDTKPIHQYGKCCQTISLHSVYAKNDENSILMCEKNNNLLHNRKRIDLESFSAKIVFEGDSTHLPRMNPGWMESCLSSNLEQSCQTNPVLFEPSSPLFDDLKAKSLATQHQVDAVITADAFEVLLQRPGYQTTRWCVPTSCESLETKNIKRSHSKKTHKRITFLDDPIPTSLTPRQCVSYGMKNEFCSKILCPSIKSLKEKQHVYTLLEIPKSTERSSLKLLVRSTNVFNDELNHPIKLRGQLEYFPERGFEEFTAHERAVWIMEKMIQPACRIVVARMDPNTGKLLKLEEKSAAHSLATNQSGYELLSVVSNISSVDLEMHFQCVADVIIGTMKVESTGNHMICLPGRDISSSANACVSVHRALRNISKEAPVIDLFNELNEARNVFLEKRFLLNCFRRWQWDQDRLPYTFPYRIE